ncbi:MAG TPA: DUF5004 domain-containing protein [Flavobacterium sp.]|nr:DUF5004 domain-containing protein [Flavobacterium sp.]
MNSKIITGLAILCFLAFGCNEPDDGSHADPITLSEKIHGDWSLMNLKMVDEYAKANDIEPFEQNISTLFHYEDFKIRFSVNEKMVATTYEVMGDVPALFMPNGYWALSSDFQQTNGQPATIYLYSDAEKTLQTGELKLTSVPGSNGEMEIQLTKSSGGAAFVSYVFKLNAI